MRNIILIGLFFVLYSCNEKEVILEKVYVHKSVSKELTYKHSLLLTIENKDSVIDYTYLAKDLIKNIKLRYHLKKDILVDDNVFIYTNKKILLKNKEYKIYGYSENVFVSHPRFILFRKDYGMIANVALGADFIFLKDSIVKVKDLNIFNEITSKINE